ncbi:MAG: extradiol ring-cleavage dioxygenase [Gaiellaceae bacterium]
MSLVFACIAPHGDVDLAPELRAAMEELGRRAAAARPDVAVVITPHSVHVEGHFAIVTSGKVGEWETDRATAAALLEAPLPILGVSYGGNDSATAEFPLDWGAEIPLGFVGAPRVVVVSPARDRPLEEHLRLGEAIAALPRRVALIASADHGHAHDPDGPYGFHPAAAEYDALLQELLAAPRLDFLPLAELVEEGKADSLWQLLVLQGAVGSEARPDVLAYAAPTYYGMLVADIPLR